jgi:hypothetical protein
VRAVLIIHKHENMAEDLTTLSAEAKESLEVEVQEQAPKEIQSCLVVKLLVDPIVGKYIIKATLIRGWKPTGTISLKVVEANLFLVEFEHVRDKLRVIIGRPWVFKGSLFSAKDFVGITPP